MIKDALDAYVKATEKTWAHDRSQTVGASEVGQCARRVRWTKLEGDPDYGVARNPDYLDGWGARVRGSVMENHFIEPALRAKFGERLKFAGAEQKTFIQDFLSATPDGLVTELREGEHPTLPAGTCVTIEIKTTDPRTNLTEAKDHNVYQTQVQMGLIRELTQYKPTHCILTYTDASFWNEGKEFLIAYDPLIFKVAKARARQIMTTPLASDLKPEGFISGGRECDRCPFSIACGHARVTVPEQDMAMHLDAAFVDEIAEKARKIKGLELLVSETSEELAGAKEELKARLREEQVRKIPGVITWASVKGRKTYNPTKMREALIEAGIDVEQFASEGQPSDRLMISLSSETEATQA